MKNIGTCLIALALFMVSCKKDHDGDEDSGCIDRIYVNKNDHDIKSADVPAADKLFSDNGIDKSNFRYIRYLHEARQRQYPPYEKWDNKVVRVDQYKNDLRVFNADMIFAFVNDKLDHVATNPVDVSALDAEPHLTLPRLRKLFSDDIKKSYSFLANYSDSCFCAEFGYYKKRTTSGNNENKTVKAWRVTPKNRVTLAGYYADDDGALIYFDPGVIID
jgi:hypothetical protein